MTQLNGNDDLEMQTRLFFRSDDLTGFGGEGEVPGAGPGSVNGDGAMMRMPKSGVRQFRAIWISDVHLGTRECRAEFLLDFLKYHDSHVLYLIGDIVDGWRLTRSWYWPQTHNDVVQKILRKARKGTRVIYIPGNHDGAFRDYTGMQFGGVIVEREVVHPTADGRRLWVTHGDQFDGIIRYAKWFTFLGDWSYQTSLVLNRAVNFLRRTSGLPYWSLSAYLKVRVKNAVKYIAKFERAVAEETRRKGLDGVVCGHIHHPACNQMDGIAYFNDGDWVEHCTALVEHFDGRFEIVSWPRITAQPQQSKAMDRAVFA